MAVVRCQGCAAPLSPEPGATQVECTYCGATTLLKKHVAVPAVATRRGKSRVGLVMLSLVAVAMLGSVGFLVFTSERGLAGVSLHEFYGVACPVEANDDGIADFAGRTGLPGSSTPELTILDGNDGSTVWTGPVAKLDAKILCLGPDLFGVAYPDFRVELWSPGASDQPVGVVKLPERLAGFGRQDDCIGLHTQDGDVFADAKTGRQAKCAVEAFGDLEPPGYLVEPHTFVDDGVEYVASLKASGTRFVTVRAVKGEQELWETRLSIVAIESGRVHFAASDDALFVYGSRPGEDSGTLVAIERDSGRVRFETSLPGRWSKHYVRTFVFNGRHIVMTWGFGLHAYDPHSGKLAWSQGGR